MNATKAIKTYFELEPHGRRIDAKELLAFKSSLSSPDEYQEFGRGCCEMLSEDYDAPEELAA